MKEGKEKMAKALEEGITVYVDMEYDVLMEDREIRSLA